MLSQQKDRYYRIAFGLAVFTIVYNIAEGLIATIIGFEDESLTLFGFGLDSFIETISGIGILHMVTRIRKHPDSHPDHYEQRALRITGASFYAFVVGLLATAIYNMIMRHQPETSAYGLIISAISILVMLCLVYSKTKVGQALNSKAMLADVECTKVCIYMSVVLLASSGSYYFFHVPYVDSVGALALAYFSFREGKECFEKAKGEHQCHH